MPVLRIPYISICSRVLLTTTICYLVSVVTAHAQPPDEAQVKAVFIYNFTNFTQWPEPALEKANRFVIGVLGQSELHPHLEAAVANEQVKGLPIEVRLLESGDEMGGCHILFVDKTALHEFRKKHSKIQDHPVLTISDAEDFLRYGGVVLFYNDNNKIRLMINAKKASDLKLEISTKLLRLATLYEEK